MVVSHQHQARMTQRLENFLEELAREHLSFGTSLDIDGVVCLANSNDVAQQVVLKVHHKTAQSRGFTERKARLPFQDTIQVPVVAWMNNNNNDMPQDLSIKDTGAGAAGGGKVSKGISLLNHTVRLSSKSPQQPAPLQLVNKLPQNTTVTSLLYQRIMDKPGKQQQQPVQLTELQAGEAEAKKKQAEKPEEADPSQGEMLCKTCSQTIYGGFSALQTHTYDKHERFVCKTCFQTFTLRCNLRRHERLHEGLKPYKCDLCVKTFSRSTDLKMHMQKHDTNGVSRDGKRKSAGSSPIGCPRCSKMLDSVEAMRFHMYKLHKSQDDAWVCTICEQLFLEQESYDEHRETHAASLQQYKRPRLADTDDENTNDDQVMRDEYQRELQAIDDDACKMGSNSEQDESSNEARTQAYPSIKKALATKSSSTNSSRNKRKGNPIKHVQIAADSEDESSFFEPIPYNTMNVETVNPESTASPVPSVESENDPLQNSYNSDILASSSFSQFSRGTGDIELPTDHLQSLQTLSQLRSPLVIKPDNNLSPMSLPRTSDILYSNSPLCHSPALSVYSNNTTLDDTATPDRSLDQTPPQPVDDTDDDKEYTCSYDQCTELCFGFKAFESHTVSVHSRYPCKLCKQTFSGKNNRTRHMRNHNRAKIYPCPDCGKYFSRPDSMREHRFIHTASYQEDKCRRCQQEFQRKSLLLAHLKNCFRQSRTKNGSIDESPYMFANTPISRPAEEDNTSSNSTLIVAADPTMRVKLENNNEAMLPSTLELTLMKKQAAAVVADNSATIAGQETALDLANPTPNNNTEEKPLDLVTSSDKPMADSNCAPTIITPELAKQVAQQVAEKVTQQQIVAAETPQVGTV